MTVMMTTTNPFVLSVKIAGWSKENKLEIPFPLGNQYYTGLNYLYEINNNLYTENTPPSVICKQPLQCQSHTIITTG